MEITQKLFLIILLFFKGIENYEIKNRDEPLDKALINLLSDIVKQCGGDKNGITILNYELTNDHLFHSVFSVIRRSEINGLYIFNNDGPKYIPKTASYLAILSENSYETLLETNIDTRSTIFLFFTDRPNEAFLKQILKHYWTYDYFNVFATIQFQTDINLFSYNGFKDLYEYIKISEYKLKLWDKTSDLNNQTINVLFTFNDHTKIRKVDYNEGTTELYEGKDYDIIKTVFQHLNADLQVIDIDDALSDPSDNPWFTYLEMENRSEVQRDILRKWNITMLTKSQRVLKNDGVIEVTYPHTDNAFTILLPKRRKITKPEEVFEYLRQPLWYLHLTFLVVLSLLFVFFRRYYGISHVLGAVKQLLRIMLTCSSQGFTGRNYEELILLGWAVWCFLASIMAQAKITSMLSTDLYENELDSLEDVYRKGKLDFVIFGLTSIVDEVAEKYEGSKYVRVIQDMVKVSMDENLGEIMLMEMPKPTSIKMAIILEYDIAKFYARHVKNRQDGLGRPFLHLMKHSILPFFQVFHVTAGSPLLPVINRKIRQLVEGGFITYFKQKYLFQGLIDGYLYPDEDTGIDEYERKPINMDLAKYAFFLLCLGLVISVICFLMEIIFHRVKNMLIKFKHPTIPL